MQQKYETRLYVAVVGDYPPVLVVHTHPSSRDPQAMVAMSFGVTAAEVKIEEWWSGPLGASAIIDLPLFESENTLTRADTLEAQVADLASRVDAVAGVMDVLRQIRRIVEGTVKSDAQVAAEDAAAAAAAQEAL